MQFFPELHEIFNNTTVFIWFVSALLVRNLSKRYTYVLGTLKTCKNKMNQVRQCNSSELNQLYEHGRTLKQSRYHNESLH